MADENKLNQAKYVYGRICDALDAKDWKYGKEEEKLLVHFGVQGDDLPMNFIIIADADRQLIRLMSPLPFNMSEEKRIDGAIAACIAGWGMADGSFDYDLSDGQIVFRMTASFQESVIGENLIHYMIECSIAMVEKYNDKFLALDKGALSINDFAKEA